MKNLKKVLALGLALVMLLGMMVFVSADDAETETKKLTVGDFTDVDEITNVNEVALLVDVGVLKGIAVDDGFAFKPADGIDRGSWAKMIYYVLEGDNSADLYKGTATKVKDIAGYWAEGEVSYLAGLGLVSGDENGNFTPYSKIRVDAAAKILLCAIGYDAEDRGYVGDTWSASIMRDAKSFGLMKGIAAAASSELTRDDAAKMIHNALSVEVVQAKYLRDNGEKYVDKYNGMNYTLGFATFGLLKVTGVVASIAADGTVAWRSLSIEGNVATAQHLGGVKAPVDASMIGQSVEFYVTASDADWENGKVKSLDDLAITGLASQKAVAGGANLLATVSTGVYFAPVVVNDVTTVDTWYTAKIGTKANPGFVVEADETVYCSYNGSDLFEIDLGDMAKAEDVNIAAGNVVEFYDTTGSKKADLLRVYEYEVAEVTGDVEVKTANGATTVKVPGVVDTAVSAAIVTGYEGLAEDDVVLRYDIPVVEDGELTDEVKGVVIEKLEGKKATVDYFDSTGAMYDTNKTKYTLSAIGMDEWTLTKMTEDVEYTIFFDKAGAVVYATTEQELTPDSNTVIVLATAVTAGTTGFNGTPGYLEAQILLLDGTVQFSKVAKIGVVNEGSDEITMTPVVVTGTEAAPNIADNELNQFYEMTENANGTVNLTKKTDVPISNAVIKAEFDFAGLDILQARNSTRFIVAKGPDATGAYKYTTYTGYKNVPGMASASGAALESATAPGVASYVFLVTDSFTGDAPAGMIYLKNAVYTSKGGVVTLNIVNADGTEGTLQVSEDVVLDKNYGFSGLINGVENTEYGGIDKFYEIESVDEDGVVTKIKTSEKNSLFKALGSWADGAFVTNSTTYAYDGDTEIILIEKTYLGKFVSVTVTNGADYKKAATGTTEIYVSVPGSGVVDQVYILHTADDPQA